MDPCVSPFAIARHAGITHVPTLTSVDEVVGKRKVDIHSSLSCVDGIESPGIEDVPLAHVLISRTVSA